MRSFQKCGENSFIFESQIYTMLSNYLYLSIRNLYSVYKGPKRPLLIRFVFLGK